MTRLILSTLFLVGITGSAGAENHIWVYPIGQGKEITLTKPCPIGDQVIDNLGAVFVCHGNKGWALQPSVCEGKMEAAMRAMNEFVPKRNPPPWVTNSGVHLSSTPCDSDDCLKQTRIIEAENEVTRARAELDRVLRREEAISQWATVTRECWREP